MTIRRDFEMSDFEAEKLLTEALDEWEHIDGVVIDPEDTQLTVDVDGVYWVQAYVRIK